MSTLRYIAAILVTSNMLLEGASLFGTRLQKGAFTRLGSPMVLIVVALFLIARILYSYFGSHLIGDIFASVAVLTLYTAGTTALCYFWAGEVSESRSLGIWLSVFMIVVTAVSLFMMITQMIKDRTKQPA